MAQNSYPYVLSPSRLKAFLVQIPRIGVPPKITTSSLPAFGFKSTNDRSIVRVLKSLDLISETGVPNKRWQSLRDQDKFAEELSKCIRIAYPDLFQTYPHAETRSEAELANFMRHHSKAGDRAVGAMVATFQILCSMADFSGESNDEDLRDVAPRQPSSKRLKTRDVEVEEHGMAPVQAAVTINLQIQLTDNTDADQIDAIFESLARHILWRDQEKALEEDDFGDELDLEGDFLPGEDLDEQTSD